MRGERLSVACPGGAIGGAVPGDVSGRRARAGSAALVARRAGRATPLGGGRDRQLGTARVWWHGERAARSGGALAVGAGSPRRAARVVGTRSVRRAGLPAGAGSGRRAALAAGDAAGEAGLGHARGIEDAV